MTSAVAATIAIASSGAESFPEGTHLYGYKESGSQAFFYELSPTESAVKWEDSNFKTTWFCSLHSGWLIDGKMYGYAVDFSFGSCMGLHFSEYDWATGELRKSTELDSWKAPFPLYAALSPAERTIYGYGYTSAMKRAFMKAPLDDPGALTIIKEVEFDEMCFGMTWNSTDNILTGMRSDGTLVSIAADGTQTPLLESGIKTSNRIYADGSGSYESASAIAWSETEKLYYWNVETPDLTVKLVTLDPATSTVTTFPGYTGEKYLFMIADCERVSVELPAAPEITGFNFPEGALSGSVALRMPSTTEAGDKISGTLEWTATLDGASHSSGTAECGSDVTVNYSDLAEGWHTFSFRVEAGGSQSAETSTSRFIGHDTPLAPANVNLTHKGLTWDAVTEGKNGGFINPAEITYEVFIDGEKVGATKETEYPMEIPQTGPLSRMTASVAATFAGKTSDAAKSNAISAGAALVTPVSLSPTASEAELFLTVDGYDDGSTWTYNSNDGTFASGYCLEEQMDEWLVLPPVELKEGARYSFTFQVRRRSSYFAGEYLEVGVATEPNSYDLSKTILVEKFTPSPEFQTIECEFEPASTGSWHFALHAISDPDMMGINAYDFKIIDTGITAISPKSVTDLSAKAAEGGALEATVTFTLPTETTDGTAISESTVITATVTAENTVTAEGKPGETLSVSVKTLQGKNTVTVTPSIGEVPGEKSTVEVYTGEDMPGLVNNLKATHSEDFSTLSLTWEPPTNGFNDGYINPETLTYNVFLLTDTYLGSIWEKIASDLTECTFTFNPESTELDYYELAVTAVSAGGSCPEVTTANGVAGTPHNLPMSDDFNSKEIYTYSPWVIYTPTANHTTQWGVLPLPVIPDLPNEEGNGLCGMGLANGCQGMSGFPVFSTIGWNNVTLTMTVWTGSNAASNIHVTGEAHGMEQPVTVGTIIPGEKDWDEYSFPLPAELTNRPWVKLYLNADFPNGTADWIVMDNYALDNRSGVDQAPTEGVTIATIAGNLIVTASQPTAVTVYRTDGTVAASTVASTSASIPLPAGIYIVTAGNHTAKVAIR